MNKVITKVNKIFSAISHGKLRDAADELVGPFRRLFVRVCGELGKSYNFRLLKNEFSEKRIIVLAPTVDWHMPLYQRPHQLASAYAKKKNTAVVYMTTNGRYDNVCSVKKVNENIWCINARYWELLRDSLSNASEVDLSISWTPDKEYIEKLKPSKIIYEYIDELEIFPQYGAEMENDHIELMKNADVTVCTATKLYNKAVNLAKNALLSPNAGDYELFSKTGDFEINPLIKNRISGYQHVLGYYGSLASWFDYDLLVEVAKLHPEWVILLVGYDYDGTFHNSELSKCDNVICVPAQPYRQLPSFLKAFDLAMIPFVINEITSSTSPVKLFEYMAAGKPILTSKMPECLKYQSVVTYKDANEFCFLAGKLLEMKPDDNYWKLLQEDALNNTWAARTEEILNSI